MKKNTVKVAVACVDANGVANMPVFEVLVTSDQVESGEHYDIAADKAKEEGYEAPFVCFDNTEAEAVRTAAHELSTTVESNLQKERYALVDVRIVENVDPVLAAAWAHLSNAENQLAFQLCAHDFESLVVFENTAFFLAKSQDQEGQYQLFVSANLEKGWDEPTTRFNLELDLQPFDANDIEEAAQQLERAVAAFETLKHQSARDVIPDFFEQ